MSTLMCCPHLEVPLSFPSTSTQQCITLSQATLILRQTTHHQHRHWPSHLPPPIFVLSWPLSSLPLPAIEQQQQHNNVDAYALAICLNNHGDMSTQQWQGQCDNIDIYALSPSLSLNNDNKMSMQQWKHRPWCERPLPLALPFPQCNNGNPRTKMMMTSTHNGDNIDHNCNHVNATTDDDMTMMTTGTTMCHPHPYTYCWWWRCNTTTLNWQWRWWWHVTLTPQHDDDNDASSSPSASTWWQQWWCIFLTLNTTTTMWPRTSSPPRYHVEYYIYR